MLVSPAHNTKPWETDRPSSTGSSMETTSTTSEENIPQNSDAQVNIDLSHIPVDSPNQKNITIEITSLNNTISSKDANLSEVGDVMSPSKDNEKLIRVKIKMPKSPGLNKSFKKEKSFFTEKDFSTLPKEFIKFANSMMGSEEERRNSFKMNTQEVKKRYYDKYLNEERRVQNQNQVMHQKVENFERPFSPNCKPSKPPSSSTLVSESFNLNKKLESSSTIFNEEGDINAISPILRDNEVTSPAISNVNKADATGHYGKIKKIEPLHFTQRTDEGSVAFAEELRDLCSRRTEYIKQKIVEHEKTKLIQPQIPLGETEECPNEGKLVPSVEKNRNNFKSYEEILTKIKPYSKYRMEYLRNLQKLRCRKNSDQHQNELDFDEDKKPSEKAQIFHQDEIGENDLSAIIKNASKYPPIMGKIALLAKLTKHHDDDSEIVKELVTEKFNPFFERREVTKTMIKRDKNNVNITCPVDTVRNDEIINKICNNLNKTVHHTTINDEVYSVVNKNNKLKELKTFDMEESRPSESKAFPTKLNSDFSAQKVQVDQEIKTKTEFVSQSRINEFSSFYSEYDVDKFVENAIGDVSPDSQTMASTVQSNRNSDDRSITTGEMSLLVSKASTISTFCSGLWRRITKKNTLRRVQPIYDAKKEEERIEEERNKRVTLLRQEEAVQSEIIRQASKALDYCENLTDLDVVSQRIEAERVILISSHKSYLIRNEIEDLKFYSRIRPTYNYLGTVTIRNLQFKIREVCGRNEDHSVWYVCILDRGTEVVATVPVQANNDGTVTFNESFTFDFLSPDFEIKVSFFALRVKKYKDTRSTFQRMRFLSFRREPKSSPHRSFTSKFSRSSLRSPTKDLPAPAIVRQTAFLPLGDATVTVKDVSKTSLTLNNIPNFANVKGLFSLTIESKVNIEERFSSFLNIGTEAGCQIVWNRRWCSLQDRTFKYWNSPEQESTDEPLMVINLGSCVGDVVLAERSVCPRARTLLLEAEQTDEETQRCFGAKFLLTSDTSQDMHNWQKCLNSVINALRAWHCVTTKQ